MRELQFRCEVQEVPYAVCREQVTQLWATSREPTLILTIYLPDAIGGTMEGAYVRVDTKLHVGYRQTSSKEYGWLGKRCMMLQFTITGLSKIREYEVAIEPEHIQK